MANKQNAEVAVVMGSDSDWSLVKKGVEILDSFGVGYEVRVLSAHRTPEEAAEFARGASARGTKVIIAAAGGAAHLAGVVAAHTTLPVIGIPVKGGAFNGTDSLLSTVQMPSGIPVATVTLGSAGPVNAAVLAVQILALGSSELAGKLGDYKESLKEKVARGNEAVARDLEES
jgi:5-(carboxyamino)imidazole ribonucleotide mutase